MQITRSKVSTKKILNRPMTVRILSLFFITQKLSTSDIQKVIGGALSHISEALNSLAIYSALEEGFSDNDTFKGNSSSYYYLMPENIEGTSKLIRTQMELDQFTEDKAKLELLLENGEITAFFK